MCQLGQFDEQEAVLYFENNEIFPYRPQCSLLCKRHELISYNPSLKH
jgi:hypothetical protein